MLISWAIALIEYIFAVPANRLGYRVYSAAELKTMREVITLLVFAGFSVLWLKEPITWHHALGFALIASGAFVIFRAAVAKGRAVSSAPVVSISLGESHRNAGTLHRGLFHSHPFDPVNRPRFRPRSAPSAARPASSSGAPAGRGIGDVEMSGPLTATLNWPELLNQPKPSMAPR